MSSDSRLAQRDLPRLPFASPATETVIGSPASVASSKTANTYAQTPRRGLDRAEKLDPVHSRSGVAAGAYKGMSGLGLETRFRQQEDFPRSKLPALSLVTNLNSISSGTAASIRQHGRKESLQMRRKISKTTKNKDAMKGPIGSLRRADSRLMELSPSDATLMIGIQIPSTDFLPMRHAPRGLDSIVNSGAIKAESPTITITPADGEGGLKVPSKNQAGSRTRQRAASSIYSQMTQQPFGIVEMPNMPPVPSLLSQSQSPDDIKADPHKSRIASWGTEIDDEPSPDFSSRPRAYSGDSQIIMLKRTSGDTLATRHRSRGWWNQILSPFVDRSNTVTTKNSPNDGRSKVFWNNDMKMPFTMSPESLKQDKPQASGCNMRESVRTSIWTDVSDWNAQRGTIDLSGMLHADRSRGELLESPSMGIIMSPGFEPVAGFGEASEYYEACWHDQNSPTPFFKCQNHICDLDPVLRASKSQVPGVEFIPSQIDDGQSTFRQAAGNRFSAAFGEAAGVRERPMSEATVIEDDPDITPEVQEARAAPIVNARAAVPATQLPYPETPDLKKEVKMPEQTKNALTSQPFPGRPYIAVLPPDSFRWVQNETESPQAVTPGLQRAMSTKQALPMSEIPRGTALTQPKTANDVNPFLDGTEASQSEKSQDQTTLTLFPPPRDPEPPSFPPPPTKPLSKADEKRLMNSKATEELKPKEAPAGEDTKPKRGKRRRLCCFITLGLLAMIILIVTLCVVLTRQHSDIPVQSAWLNITGYPPIPTGIATIAQPNAVVESPGCIEIETMWSCAVPKEQQASIAPNDADQPNFRVEIRYDNGAATGNGTVTSRRAKRHQRRDAFTSSLYTPDPAPPSDEEQVFLGNTTDGNVAPFDGEITPFYMSFLPTTPTPSRVVKRQQSNITDPFPNITSLIPSPDVNSDGTAAAADLLPFPSAQPLRLYNRGLPTEHYGFYNYFDRSIFLQYNVLTSNNSNSDPDIDDENGSSTEDTATVRCTWAQTRFLVQIWTRQNTLLPSLATPTSTPSSQPTSTPNATNSSANDFTRPGSFPYPVSITLDRHGGDPTKKMIYCYGMDDNEHILSQEKQIEIENRAFGGTIINPAGDLFQAINVTLAQGGPGGVDGGTGGCECRWQNWVGNGS